MPKKRKKKSAGLGSRYGKKPRERYKNVKRKTSKKNQCPNCNKTSLKRKASGVWECTSCKTKVAGGAYQSETKVLKKALETPSDEENLEELKEEGDKNV